MAMIQVIIMMTKSMIYKHISQYIYHAHLSAARLLVVNFVFVSITFSINRCRKREKCMVTSYNIDNYDDKI